jgi:hypothetical protein
MACSAEDAQEEQTGQRAVLSAQLQLLMAAAAAAAPPLTPFAAAAAQPPIWLPEDAEDPEQDGQEAQHNDHPQQVLFQLQTAPMVVPAAPLPVMPTAAPALFASSTDPAACDFLLCALALSEHSGGGAPSPPAAPAQPHTPAAQEEAGAAAAGLALARRLARKIAPIQS